MRIYHAESVHQLLSIELLRSQESVSQECDRPCPFCQRDFERPHVLQHHLAGHLEIIALLSLPKLDDIENNSEAGKVQSNEANRNYAESKADDFDRTIPLVFRDNDPSEGTQLATRIDTVLFELGLKAQSISFESRNEATIEAHESYSKEIVGKWLSESPYREHDMTGDRPPVPIKHHESFDHSESSHSSEPTEEEKFLGWHWLPDVWSQSRPATLLEDPGQTSVLLGPHMPGSEARLLESYIRLLELPFEDGDILVRMYQRTSDGRSRFFCRIVRPPRVQKDCDLPLVSLSFERSGPFLKLHHIDTKNTISKLWACLKFGSYESTFVEHCSLYTWVIALRVAGIAESSP